MKCLFEVMLICDKKIKGLFSMVVDYIGETFRGLCKFEGCNMELVFMCMIEVGVLLKMFF